MAIHNLWVRGEQLNLFPRYIFFNFENFFHNYISFCNLLILIWRGKKAGSFNFHLPPFSCQLASSFVCSRNPNKCAHVIWIYTPNGCRASTILLKCFLHKPRKQQYCTHADRNEYCQRYKVVSSGFRNLWNCFCRVPPYQWAWNGIKKLSVHSSFKWA